MRLRQRATQEQGSQGPRPLHIHPTIRLIHPLSNHLFFQLPIHSIYLSIHHPIIIYPPSTPCNLHPSIHLIIHSTLHSFICSRIFIEQLLYPGHRASCWECSWEQEKCGFYPHEVYSLVGRQTTSNYTHTHKSELHLC